MLVALGASPASAQDAAKKKKSAELLFQEGQQLIKDGKHAAACPKFEQSQKLDPAIGTLLNLAHCYELVRAAPTGPQARLASSSRSERHVQPDRPGVAA